MPRYFLHLRDGTDELLDEEGHEFADHDDLHRGVMVTARDLMKTDVERGLIDLRYRIDAEDEQGNVIYSLPFKHAVSIVPEPA
jgi:hypothetical protein